MITPGRDDYIAAAELRNHRRKKRIRVGTIDALLTQLCIQHGLEILTTDKDFSYTAGSGSFKDLGLAWVFIQAATFAIRHPD